MKGECGSLTRPPSRAKGHRVGLRGSGDALLLAACVNEEAHVATQHPCCNTAHRVATTKERTAKTARHSNASKYLRRRPSPSAIAVGHRRRPLPPRQLDPPDRCCAPRGRSLRLNRELAYPGSAGVGVRKRERPQRAPALVDAAREGQPGFSIPFARVGVRRWLVRRERALHESEARLQHGATWRKTVQHGATQYNMLQMPRAVDRPERIELSNGTSSQ